MSVAISLMVAAVAVLVLYAYLLRKEIELWKDAYATQRKWADIWRKEACRAYGLPDPEDRQ